MIVAGSCSSRMAESRGLDMLQLPQLKDHKKVWLRKIGQNEALLMKVCAAHSMSVCYVSRLTE